MDVYAENILDHYRHPRNHGTLTDPSVTHEEVNHSCGDAITVTLQIDADRLTAIKWSGVGCAIAQAAMSMLSEEIIGWNIAKVGQLNKEDIYTKLGVPIGPRRFKCALLGLHTIKNALQKFLNQPVQSWAETAGVA